MRKFLATLTLTLALVAPVTPVSPAVTVSAHPAGPCTLHLTDYHVQSTGAVYYGFSCVANGRVIYTCGYWYYPSGWSYGNC